MTHTTHCVDHAGLAVLAQAALTRVALHAGAIDVDAVGASSFGSDASQTILPTPQALVMVVDLDERGAFSAHVDDACGQAIFSFTNEDDETGWPSKTGLWLVEDGYMRHNRDGEGLLDYLQAVGLAHARSSLTVEG